MRYQKRFLFFTVVILCAMILKFGSFGRDLEEVSEFRGANIQADVFHPLMAESANSKKMMATINGRSYTNGSDHIYMNDDLVLMVPIHALRDSLNCSVHIYQDQMLYLQKSQLIITMSIDGEKMKINEDGEVSRITLSAPLTKTDYGFFVPLKDLAKFLHFTYSWNVEDNVAIAQNDSDTDSFLPYKYDLRSLGRVGTIKDQGIYGTCWAFASLSALESTLLPEEDEEFSPDHMSIRNSFSSDQNSGGEYTMGMAYLTAWQGPVLEEDDPYGDGESPDGLKAEKHVQEVQILPGKDYEQIKAAVFKYGGVQTSIYNAMDTSESATAYYNPTAHAYCYQGEAKPNHDIVIIGWDDNYSRSNFNTSLEGDGAFLCQNSWGEGFGDDGVFYVSYYDTNIGIHSISYTGIESADNYDRIYQSDLCGWVGQLGYNKSSLYAANIYKAKSNETLKAVGFYATGTDTEYEVYVTSDFTGTDSLENGRLVASGTFQNAGYYTVKLNRVVNLMKGKKYAIILKIKTPGSKRPLAVEYASSDVTADVDLSDGVGYISAKGTKWERVEKAHKCNICLKAYTKVRD